MIKKSITKILCTAVAVGAISVAIPGVSSMALERNNSGKVLATIAINQDELQELTYGVEEMKIAINHLENDNLLDEEISNRVKIFGETSVERVRGLEVYNNDEDKEAQAHIKWIEISLNRLHDTEKRVQRLDREIEKCKILFSEDDIENKENALDDLNLAIIQERQAGELNNATLSSAVKELHKFASQINE